MCVLFGSVFEFLSFIVSCVLFALLAVLCVCDTVWVVNGFSPWFSRHNRIVPKFPYK